MAGFSQFDRGVDPRDFADGEENPIPPHCDRCAKTLDDEERDLCARCEWETNERERGRS